MMQELSKINISPMMSSQALWDDNEKLEEVRKLFAPKLSDMEFKFFVGLGKASGLNPFAREIWCVKYQDNAPAQVFIGRDGYRKAAQAHREYDYHQCDAVYENDKFQIINGEVRHSYTLAGRGQLIGAYCVAKRHKSSRPIYVFADLKEYSTGKSLWNAQTGKPATMIKKVAESQCLRACFQDLLGGTYGEEEMNRSDSSQNVYALKKSDLLMEKINTAKGHSGESGPVIIENEDGELVTPKQIDTIDRLLFFKDFDDERLQKAFAHYRVEGVHQMTKAQAQDFIDILSKISEKEVNKEAQ